MIQREIAGMHAYRSATEKGYATKRRQEWKRSGTVQVPATGEVNVTGWKQLEALTAKAGLPVQHGGDRLVATA